MRGRWDFFQVANAPDTGVSNPALNSVGFEGCNEPAGSHRRFAEQEHADLFVKEVGGEPINPAEKGDGT